MNPNTGEIAEMTEQEAKAKRPPWVPIPKEDESRVIAMPTEDRIRWAQNQKRSNRAKNKAARAARRKNR